MKKLKAQIKPVELFGKVNISLSPANGRLQAKTVYPSEVKQEVLPTENHFALSRVVVEAAPLQAVTLNPSELMQNVAPDANHYGIDSVTVNPAPLQEKTVTPTKAKQTISPDDGFYGMKKVIVEAMADSGALQQKTVSPSAEEQTITPDSGYYGIGSVTVKAAELQEKFVEATDEEQVITADEGFYGLASVTVAPNYNSGGESGGGDTGGGDDSGDDGGDTGGDDSGGDSSGTGGGGSSSLSAAEDVAFGTDVPEKEYGLVNITLNRAYSGYKSVGYKFTPNGAISITGFRFLKTNAPYNVRMALWDVASGVELTALSIKAVTADPQWVEGMLATPVTLEAGKTYMVVYTTPTEAFKYYALKAATANSRITMLEHLYSSTSEYPDKVAGTSTYYGIDIILSAPPVVLEDEYIIQSITLNALTDEVKRITRMSGVLKPAETLVVLKGIPTLTETTATAEE